MNFLLCMKKEFIEFTKNKKFIALLFICLIGNYILESKEVENLTLYQGIFLIIMIFQFVFDITKNDFSTGGMIFLLNTKSGVLSVIFTKILFGFFVFCLLFLSSNLGKFGSFSLLKTIRLLILALFVAILTFDLTIITHGTDFFAMVLTMIISVGSMYVPTIFAIALLIIAFILVFPLYKSKTFRMSIN